MLALLDQTEPFVANETEAVIAHEAAERLSAVANAGQDVQLVVREQPNVVVPLPARAVQLIVQILETMAEQRPFSVIPHESELTTQQAADYLNVSRPYLVNLLTDGLIPYRMVGTHRRIKFGDLLKFEDSSQEKRKDALKRLAAEAKALGLD